MNDKWLDKFNQDNQFVEHDDGFGGGGAEVEEDMDGHSRKSDFCVPCEGPCVYALDESRYSAVAEQVMRFSTATCTILWPNVASMSDLDIERQQFVEWLYQHPEHTDWGEALMEYRHGKEA